jgi:hypothetical protein
MPREQIGGLQRRSPVRSRGLQEHDGTEDLPALGLEDLPQDLQAEAHVVLKLDEALVVRKRPSDASRAM